ncbi:carbon storage regulator [Shinella pollutisoli]|uniref:Carbon storage regulator n=1 Tax=Shinella pollutisoli TaxID=2250594 RepID=A0ABV7DKZ8_9HYPH|nr:carbon storage regulator [Shinella pollutisoli]
MLRLTVKVGQQVQIEGVGTIHVDEKSGRCVKLGFETEYGPIRIVDAEGDRRPTEQRPHAD